MKIICKYTLLVILLFPLGNGFSQIKEVGLPFIVNHQRSVYNASTQNWAITQNSKGFMYFANNDGILEYDGTHWNVYPVPNASVIRSVLAAGDTIFAGAFEQMGYLAPNKEGILTWNPMEHLIPEEYATFDEIWNIFRDNDRLIFQSFSYIFIWEDNQFKTIKPQDSFSFMHEVEGSFYVVDREQGLMRLQGDSLLFVANHPVFFRNEITCMLSHKEGNIIIGTSNEGLFLWNGKELAPWQSQVNTFIKQNNLFAGTMLSGGNYAFGSVSNGIYITDAEGVLLQHLNRIKGLQNNTILALYQDQRNNLWLGLDNGIDYLEISSPLTLLNHNFNIESAYASVLHNEIIYVGTNQGLFASRWEDIGNSADKPNTFQLINGTKGQVWSLQVIDNTLFCGHNYGCFQVEGFNARQISDIRGFWSFLKPAYNSDIILAGTYTGLVRLEKRQNQWYLLDEVEGFRESSRDMFIDRNNNLWVTHGYRGLFKLRLNEDYSVVENVDFLRGKKGLPPQLPYNIQEVNGKMYITTHDGILRYDYTSESFIYDDEMNVLFANKGFIDMITQDNNGNLWYFTDNYLGIMRLLEDGSFRDIVAPFSRINDFLLPAFQNIFIADAQNVFIGSQNGLVHYNPAIINDFNIAEEVYFRNVSFYGNHQTVTFSLFSPEIKYNQDSKPNLPFSLNSVTIRFTAAVYETPSSVRFSYRLKGFDTSWSDWDVLNFKEYTNLLEGDYSFEVKALNAFGIESPVNTFHFSVSPPFFRSNIAYTIYAVLLLLIFAANFYFVRRRMLKIRQREKFRHEKRLALREQLFKEQSALSEREIMQLRNDSLQSEMKHKNRELANATLHLIQKNKTLNYLKNDLGKLQRNLPPDNPEKHSVNNLLKKVNRDLRNEKNWELFNDYFDDVHQDFISRLKEKHSELSPKELRLCAYLRMNLSSKEIAPLMNISIRGVEISRYRLRKKLQLEHDTNLTEYLISY